MVTFRVKDRLQMTGIVIAMIGLSMLCQPFTIELYRYGFQVLAIGGILLIFPGFLPTKD